MLISAVVYFWYIVTITYVKLGRKNFRAGKKTEKKLFKTCHKAACHRHVVILSF
jgi:hypothetical protein